MNSLKQNSKGQNNIYKSDALRPQLEKIINEYSHRELKDCNFPQLLRYLNKSSQGVILLKPFQVRLLYRIYGACIVSQKYHQGIPAMYYSNQQEMMKFLFSYHKHQHRLTQRIDVKIWKTIKDLIWMINDIHLNLPINRPTNINVTDRYDIQYQIKPEQILNSIFRSETDYQIRTIAETIDYTQKENREFTNIFHEDLIRQNLEKMNQYHKNLCQLINRNSILATPSQLIQKSCFEILLKKAKQPQDFQDLQLPLWDEILKVKNNPKLYNYGVTRVINDKTVQIQLYLNNNKTSILEDMMNNNNQNLYSYPEIIKILTNPFEDQFLQQEIGTQTYTRLKDNYQKLIGNIIALPDNGLIQESCKLATHICTWEYQKCLPILNRLWIDRMSSALGYSIMNQNICTNLDVKGLLIDIYKAQNSKYKYYYEELVQELIDELKLRIGARQLSETADRQLLRGAKRSILNLQNFEKRQDKQKFADMKVSYKGYQCL